MSLDAFAAVNTPEWLWYVAWYEKDRNRRYGQAARTGALHGFRAGRASTVSWETISRADREHHRDTCRDTCVFCEAFRLRATCVSCQADTEALGADEISRCCGSDTYLKETYA